MDPPVRSSGSVACWGYSKDTRLQLSPGNPLRSWGYNNISPGILENAIPHWSQESKLALQSESVGENPLVGCHVENISVPPVLVRQAPHHLRNDAPLLTLDGWINIQIVRLVLRSGNLQAKQPDDHCYDSDRGPR